MLEQKNNSRNENTERYVYILHSSLSIAVCLIKGKNPQLQISFGDFNARQLSKAQWLKFLSDFEFYNLLGCCLSVRFNTLWNRINYNCHNVPSLYMSCSHLVLIWVEPLSALCSSHIRHLKLRKSLYSTSTSLQNLHDNCKAWVQILSPMGSQTEC